MRVSLHACQQTSVELDAKGSHVDPIFLLGATSQPNTSGVSLSGIALDRDSSDLVRIRIPWLPTQAVAVRPLHSWVAYGGITVARLKRGCFQGAGPTPFLSAFPKWTMTHHDTTSHFVGHGCKALLDIIWCILIL